MHWHVTDPMKVVGNSVPLLGLENLMGIKKAELLLGF